MLQGETAQRGQNARRRSNTRGFFPAQSREQQQERSKLKQVHDPVVAGHRPRRDAGYGEHRYWHRPSERIISKARRQALR